MNKDFWDKVNRLEELAGKIPVVEWYHLTVGKDRHAVYIAAANPAMILEMIAEMRRLEKEADWLAAILAGNLKIQGIKDGLRDPAGGHAEYWREAARKAVQATIS